MAGYNYDDIELTDEERAWLEEAEAAQGRGTAVGGGIGSLLGGAAGVGLGAATGGVLAPLVPILSGAGGALGGALGSAFGGSSASDAEEKARKSISARQKKSVEALARQKAIDELIADFMPRVRGL